MEKYLPAIGASPLFRDIPTRELPALLEYLGAVRREYGKNQYIFHAGERTRQMGLVLSGGVQIVREDVWGRRNLMARLGPGDLFGEVYACLPHRALAVSAVAGASAQVLLLEAARLWESGGEPCPFRGEMTRRLLLILAERNLMMSEKLIHATQRSTREKLLSYLSAEARRQGRTEFRIPFSRQQLADYLAVDRSAMSAVLGRMRDEGLLEFRRGRFKLKF